MLAHIYAFRRRYGLSSRCKPTDTGSFALAELPDQEPRDPDFQPWDSYRTVRWRGQVLTLVSLQAEVVGM